MNGFNAYCLLSALFFALCPACDYLSANDVCEPIGDEVTSCHEYDSDLDHCDAYSEEYAPGCHVEEVCTDYSKVDASERDGQSGVDCRQVCTSDIGNDSPPVSCEVLDQETCYAAVYCEWVPDPDNVDRATE